MTERPGTDRSEAHAAGGGGRDYQQAVDGLMQTVRAILTPELTHQWEDLLRRLLEALRELIGWALEQLDRRREPVEVEDIPVG